MATTRYIIRYFTYLHLLFTYEHKLLTAVVRKSNTFAALH